MAGAAALSISAATLWGVAIRASPRKLAVPSDLFDRAQMAGAQPLPITWTHARGVADLPPHHAVPFERLLIAQGRAETLTLVSVNRQFAACQVALLSG